jgi:hypothetical protein
VTKRRCIEGTFRSIIYLELQRYYINQVESDLLLRLDKGSLDFNKEIMDILFYSIASKLKSV